MVASGTTSKQIRTATDAKVVGYGGMLGEGMLAVLVILACCAGVGMNGNLGDRFCAGVDFGGGPRGYGRRKFIRPPGLAFVLPVARNRCRGWLERPGAGEKIWRRSSTGARTSLSALGVAVPLGVAIMSVMVACFAATTLDTANTVAALRDWRIGNQRGGAGAGQQVRRDGHRGGSGVGDRGVRGRFARQRRTNAVARCLGRPINCWRGWL